MFAGAAGAGRLIAAMNAGFLQGEKCIVRRKDGIGEPKRAKRLTAMRKTVVGKKIKPIEKTWMTLLPHPDVYGIRRSQGAKKVPCY